MSKELTMLPRSSLGFTGTQKGMTNQQMKVVSKLLDSYQPSFCIHGDCIGADTEFHKLCMEKGILVAIHPARGTSKRAYNVDYFDMAEEELPLVRNRDIVRRSDRMIAAPGTLLEVLSSGTWATIRYALKVRKPIAIVYPDGIVKYPLG